MRSETDTVEIVNLVGQVRAGAPALATANAPILKKDDGAAFLLGKVGTGKTSNAGANHAQVARKTVGASSELS